MLNETGISIILTDTQEELQRLIRTLDVKHYYPLADIEDVSPDSLGEVFYLVSPDTARLRRIVQLLHIKRGLISIAGKREFIGFNVDWKRRILSESDLDRALAAANPPAAVHQSPSRTRAFEFDHEPDDPFLSLGYSRR